jgi:hypothetical protein
VDSRLRMCSGRTSDEHPDGATYVQSICTPCATFIAPENAGSYGPRPMVAHLAGSQNRERRRTVAYLSWVALCVVVVLGTSCASPLDSGVQPLHIKDSGSGLVARVADSSGGEAGGVAGQAVILAAWRSAQQAFEDAALLPDPAEPALSATTVNPQLSFTEALLGGIRASGDVARGPVDLGVPRVVASTSNEATVRSCLHDAEIVVSRTTGQPVPGIDGRVANELVVSLMVKTESEWMLSDQTVREDECGTP